MSTNESLVLEIQAGNTEKMTDLWNQVERLIRWKARRVTAAINESGISSGVEFEDLCQCGYFALAAAVASYRPENGAFTTWLMFRLKTTFVEATGYRTKRQMQDPLRRAVSLDLPVGEDEESSFSEIIPDPAAEAMLSAVLEREVQEQRREAVRAAVARLPALERSVIDCRFFRGMGIPDTAATLRITEKDARKLESNALRFLRHPDRARKLREFGG